MFDVDHFKRVNDGEGHLAGDAVLKNLAAVLSRGIRAEDVLARYGGEEFVVLLRGVDIRTATIIAERLRGLVERASVAFEGRDLRITVSAGVVSLAECGGRCDKAAVLRLADQRLYRAKETGRNRVVGP
jgi:diguanylate cyclase (GGDEF)-like protein